MPSDHTIRAAGRDATRDLIDLHEGRRPVQLMDDSAVAALLRATRRIAVIGASPDPERPSNEIMAYLLGVGYDCVPVTPTAPEVLGRPAFRTLAAAVEATGPVGIVDVFRRAEACPGHAEEAVAAGAECLWLQLGIASWEAARIARAGNLGVVMDRCLMVEHRRLLGR